MELACTPTQCVRYYFVWLPIATRRCTSCYWCIQDRYLLRCRRILGATIFDLLLGFLPICNERWSDVHLALAVG